MNTFLFSKDGPKCRDKISRIKAFQLLNLFFSDDKEFFEKENIIELLSYINFIFSNLR